MSKDPIKEYMKDPDRKAKVFLLVVGAQILTTILIVVGTIIGILWLVGVI